MEIKVFNSINNEFLENWMRLWEKSSESTYSNSPFWFKAVRTVFNINEFILIGIYQRNELIGAGGLFKIYKYGLPMFTLLPGDFVCGNPFLITQPNDEVYIQLGKTFQSLGTVFLDNVPGNFADGIQKGVTMFEKNQQAINYYLPITVNGNGQVILASRNKLLKGIRGLEGQFKLVMKNGKDKKALQEIFKLDILTSKSYKGYSTFANAQIKSLFELLCTHGQEYVQLNILYFNAKPIAYEIGFTAANTYFGNQIAYLQEFARFSPGKVLLVYLIESFGNRGIKRMDFGSGDNFLKRLFTNNQKPLYQIIISQNPLICAYLLLVTRGRGFAYDKIHNNQVIYGAYKKLQSFVKK